MTSRRLLQRPALLPLAALLCALVAACGGDGSGAAQRGACPAYLQVARQPSTQNRTPADIDLSQSVTLALQAATELYIGQFDVFEASRSAYEAAQAEGSRRGLNIPAVISGSGVGPDYYSAFARFGALIRGSPDEQPIINAALRGFAASFQDDHTYFLGMNEWEAFEHGSFYSSGVITGPGERETGYVVTEVLPGSSGQAAGLMPGDKIIAAKTATGNERTFTVVKRGAGPETVEVTLSASPLPWLRHELLGDTVGYLRIYHFPSFQTCESLVKIRGDLEAAISDLRTRGAQAWVFDFRDNGGGSGESAALVATHLGFDGLLYTARYKNGYRYDRDVLAENAIGNAPLAILVNGRSASSSEIVAYALQDERRARVFGTQSAGAVVAAVARVGSSRVDLQACKLEYSIVSPK